MTLIAILLLIAFGIYKLVMFINITTEGYKTIYKRKNVVGKYGKYKVILKRQDMYEIIAPRYITIIYKYPLIHRKIIKHKYHTKEHLDHIQLVKEAIKEFEDKITMIKSDLWDGDVYEDEHTHHLQ